MLREIVNRIRFSASPKGALYTLAKAYVGAAESTNTEMPLQDWLMAQITELRMKLYTSNYSRTQFGALIMIEPADRPGAEEGEISSRVISLLDKGRLMEFLRRTLAALASDVLEEECAVLIVSVQDLSDGDGGGGEGEGEEDVADVGDGTVADEGPTPETDIDPAPYVPPASEPTGPVDNRIRAPSHGHQPIQA
jgi:hypothetical protein